MDLNEYAKQVEGLPGVNITRDALGNVISVDHTSPEPNQRPSRGGARPGSGRKPLPEDAKKITISFRVSSETKEALQELRANGVDINAELERMVRRLKRDTKG